MLQKLQTTVITLLVIALVATGCADHESISKRYQAEKLLFDANRMLKNFTVSGLINDAANRQTLLAAFSDTYDFSVEALASLQDAEPIPEIWELRSVAFSAANRVGQLHFANRDYESGVDALNRLIAEVPLPYSPTVTSHLNLGQALHASGNIDSAIATYDNVLALLESPVDDRGMIVYPLFNLPLHVYQVLKAAGNSEAAAARFIMAENYYSKFLSDEQKSLIHNACHTNLSMLYLEGRFFELSVEHLLTVSDSLGEPHMAAQIRAIDIMTEELNDLKSAERQLSQLLENRDKRDTLYYPVLLWRTAHLEMKKHAFAEARIYLNLIKNEYRGFYNRTPTIQLLIAQSFEGEKNWSRANLEFDLLVRKYPYSDQAMATYLHRADLSDKQGNSSETKRLLEEAEQVYDKMMSRGKGTLLEARAATFMADLHSRNGNWDSAGDLLVAIGQNFKGSSVSWRALTAAADIYENQLNNSAKADSLRKLVTRDMAKVNEKTNLADQIIE